MSAEPEYEVGISGAIRERLVRLYRHAAIDGRGDAFIAALEAVVARLCSDPLTDGEELFDLRAMNVAVKLAVRYPLVVEFAALPDRRQVVVRAARYLGPD